MAYELLGKGAESYIYTGKIFEYKLVIKQRIGKPYRNKLFDIEFRRVRTKTEGKILIDLFLNGLNVPAPLFIDLENYIIIMEYIEGRKLIEIINNIAVNKLIKYARELGSQVAKMHSLDIYHGDLTLGNILVTRDDKIYLIDFGLAGYSRDVEEYAIDLHLLRRNLLAVSPDLYNVFFENFLEGYRSNYSKDYNAVIKRLKEIQLRGRYIEERLKKRIEKERYIE